MQDTALKQATPKHIPWPKLKLERLKQKPIFLLLCFTLLFFLQINFHRFCTDVNWVLVMNERWLNGEKLYSDFIENNPPFTLFLYTPGVFMARLLGISALSGLLLQIIVCLGICLSLCYYLLKEILHQRFENLNFIAVIIFAIFLVLPFGNLGQRDYFGAVFALPLLACMVAKLEGRKIPILIAITSGIFAGLCACIKPPFAMIFVLPWLWVLYQRGIRSAMLGLEYWVCLGVFIAYLFFIVHFFPIYIQTIMPIVLQIYLSTNGNIVIMMALSLLFSFFLVCLLRHETFDTTNPVFTILWLAACGGLLTYISQNKGFGYHAIPFVFFYLLTYLFLSQCKLKQAPCSFAPLVYLREKTAFITPFIVTGVPFILTAYLYGMLWHNEELPIIKRDLSVYGSKPTMMEISTQMIGTQLVHDYSAQWVGSEPNLWVSLNCIILLDRYRYAAQEEAKIKSLIAFERALTLKDIQTRKPDVIFVGEYDDDVLNYGDGVSTFWQDYWMKAPDFAKALADYELGDFDHGVSIYYRKLVPAI